MLWLLAFDQRDRPAETSAAALHDRLGKRLDIDCSCGGGPDISMCEHQ
jgi:hypothetical protein